jgi:hypothetical protein
MAENKEQLQKKRKGGRPRVYDPEKLIEEMLEWSKDEESINFTAFCAERGYLPGLIWRLEQENQDFADAYMLVRMRLAERRERLLNAEALNYGAFQRYQKGYDPFLQKAEDIEADKDVARKSRIAEKEHMNLFMIAKLASEGSIKQSDS